MELAAPGQSDLLIGAQGVIHHHRGQLLGHITSPVAGHQRTSHANTDSRFEEIVAIKALTAQRDEQIPRLQRTAVGADVFKRPSQGCGIGWGAAALHRSIQQARQILQAKRGGHGEARFQRIMPSPTWAERPTSLPVASTSCRLS